MPRTFVLQRHIAAVLALFGVCPLAACPRPTPPVQTPPPVETEAAPPPAADASPSQSAAGPPIERYATLPPGAEQGDHASDAATSTPADPGVLPNAGSYSLTGVRLGMTAAEIYGRYPADSGWEYDSKFVRDTGTGMIMAKPKDARARASELFYLERGQVVAFLRAVKEDTAGFESTRDGLTQLYGAGEEAPPQWARASGVMRSWRSTPNEVSRFWGNSAKRVVLTAGRSTGGGETIYMLLNVDRIDSVKQVLAEAGQTAPESPAGGWASPPPATGGEDTGNGGTVW